MAFLPLLTFGLVFASLSGVVDALKEVNVPSSQLSYEIGNWTFSDTGRYCAQDHYWTRGAGSTVSYNFSGMSIEVYGFDFSDGARVEFNLDGQRTTVDTRVTTYNCTVTFFSSAKLPWGQHSLSIRTLDAETFYIRGLSYVTYDDTEMASIALASASSVRKTSTGSSTGSATATGGSTSSRKKKSNAGAIGGGIAAAVLGSAVILTIIITLIKRRRNKKKSFSADIDPIQPVVEWKQPPPPFSQATTHNTSGTPYSTVSSYPTVSTAGSGYGPVVSYHPHTPGVDHAIPVQYGYTSKYPPTDPVTQPLLSDSNADHTLGYHGYPQPMDYSNNSRQSAGFSPPPVSGLSTSSASQVLPGKTQQSYPTYNDHIYPSDGSRTPAPAYSSQGMYPHH